MVAITPESIVGVVADLMDVLEPREQSRTVQLLAARYLGDRTQVCGWCQTGYRTPAEAAECARTCRERALSNKADAPRCPRPAAHMPAEHAGTWPVT